jgi:hypothetical protein
MGLSVEMLSVDVLAAKIDCLYKENDLRTIPHRVDKVSYELDEV